MRDDGLMYCSAKPDEEGRMDLNNGFTSFHLTPIHFCDTMSLCTWCSSRIKKRPQLFFDKNKLAIAVGPVGHKHTAAKYSCHSSQLIWKHWYCLSPLKLFPSSHAVSALHAAHSSDCRMIILKKKKRKIKPLQQGKIIAMHVELKLPLFQSSLFWVLLTDSWPKMGHFFAEVEVTNYLLVLL